MIKPKMKPILFSTPMVQAILREENPKTNTRRVILPQPVLEPWDGTPGMWKWKDCQWMDGGLGMPQSGVDDYAPCRPGDVLWVRETFARHGVADFALKGKVNPEKNPEFNDGTIMGFGNYIYKADEYEPYDNTYIITWKPSIFMPKEAARIFLHVTDVRAERLQDISTEDAIAEGFEGVKCDHPNIRLGICTDCYNHGWLEPPTADFAQTWEALNAKRGYGWDKNPWVWVYAFRRIEKEEAYREAS